MALAFRSAITASTIAWARWVFSAVTSGAGLSVKTAWWRHTWNRPSCSAAASLPVLRSGTRRTISRAVTCWDFAFEVVNAAYAVSATCASEISSPRMELHPQPTSELSVLIIGRPFNGSSNLGGQFGSGC